MTKRSELDHRITAVRGRKKMKNSVEEVVVEDVPLDEGEELDASANDGRRQKVRPSDPCVGIESNINFRPASAEAYPAQEDRQKALLEISRDRTRSAEERHAKMKEIIQAPVREPFETSAPSAGNDGGEPEGGRNEGKNFDGRGGPPITSCDSDERSASEGASAIAPVIEEAFPYRVVQGRRKRKKKNDGALEGEEAEPSLAPSSREPRSFGERLASAELEARCIRQNHGPDESTDRIFDLFATLFGHHERPCSGAPRGKPSNRPSTRPQSFRPDRSREWGATMWDLGEVPPGAGRVRTWVDLGIDPDDDSDCSDPEAAVEVAVEIEDPPEAATEGSKDSAGRREVSEEEMAVSKPSRDAEEDARHRRRRLAMLLVALLLLAAAATRAAFWWSDDMIPLNRLGDVPTTEPTRGPEDEDHRLRNRIAAPGN